MRLACRGFVLVLAAAAFAGAQQQTTRGRVMDAVTSEPLALAEIRDAASGVTAKTDGAGRFEVTAAAGARLRVTLVGYRLLTVAAPAQGELEIALHPDGLRRSDAVDVRAGPFGAERDLAVALSGNELRNLASVLADDPLRAVQSLPGVASNDDFRAQFAVRGAGFERVGVYLDGILIHAPFHTVQGEPLSASLSIIQGEMLESANVHAGPLAPLYADRTGGVLDFRSREGDSRRTSARLTAGASNAGASAEGPIGRRATWLVAARKSYLQYIINRTSNEPSLSFAFWDVQGKVSVAATSRHRLSFTAIDGHSGLDRDPARVQLGLNTLSDSNYRYTLGYAGWRYVRDGFTVDQRAGLLDEHFDNFNRERTPLQQGAYREAIWNADGSRAWSPKLLTEFGWTLRNLSDRGFLDRAAAGGVTVRLSDYRGKGTRSGAYVQQSVSLGPRVQLRAGGRRDYHSTDGRGVWLGHAGLTARAWRGATWHAAWSQTAQYPDMQQFFFRPGIGVPGNTDLQPMRSAQAQAGFEQALGERTRVRLEVYDRQDRLILFQPFGEPRVIPGSGAIYAPPLIAPWENSVSGYGRGAQIFAQRRAANGFTGWASYGYNRSRLRDRRTGNRFDADFEARHLVQIYASQRIRPTVNLSAKFVYGSGMPLRGYFRQTGENEFFLSTQRNQVRLPHYQRTDLRINKLFVRQRFQLTLFAEGINLTNRRNVRFDDIGGFDARTGRARPQLERTFPILPSAGIVADF